MKEITKKEWREKPRDYKGIINKQRYALMLTEKGTCLVPVKIRKESK